ncbi:MAG: hypothetical protein ACK4E3_11430 [Brevundimonas sp.]|uniref:hypothetical protein n=1 Tax=Brevundimonas sp. TaxID=1871086 RepID=UPI00391C1144
MRQSPKSPSAKSLRERPLVLATAFAAMIGAVTLIGSGSGGSAQAQVAAKVESQTRPNFGILLDPPTRTRPRHRQRRWNYGEHHPGWRPPLPGPILGQEEIVLIDCGGNSGSGALEHAVARVRPGGTLIVRARGGPCVGWLNIDKPMTIMGEGGFDRRDWDRHPAASIQAPAGLPCMTVAQGVRVEVRDIVFESRHAGQAACVVGYGAQLIFHRTGFRHGGDEAAIYADGGLIDIRGSVIEAATVAPAIIADSATLTAHEVDISQAITGIEIIPGPGEPSRLTAVHLNGTEAQHTFGPRSIGLLVRAARNYGRVEVERSRICGYIDGIVIEGASVDVRHSRICRADKGAVVYNGELSLIENRIRATEVGFGVVSGRAVANDNTFSRVQQVYYAEPRASVDLNGNRVYTRANLCRPQLVPVWRDRYRLIYPRHQGFECVYTSYPGNWWAEEEGWYGIGYYDDAYQWPGYHDFHQGWGWYDQGGAYVPDRRYFGDDRWGQRRSGGGLFGGGPRRR